MLYMNLVNSCAQLRIRFDFDHHLPDCPYLGRDAVPSLKSDRLLTLTIS